MRGNPSCQKQPTLITSAARKQAESLLSGGVWVPRSWFVSKMRRHGHAITMLGDALGLAESDFGAFVCLPTDSTPEIAPDEALAAAGVPKRSAPILAIRAWHEERRLGEMIRAQNETVGLRGPEHFQGGGSKGSYREPLPNAPPTLADVGISKKLSSRSQAIAGKPAEHGGQYLLAI